ncbi:MAG: SEC-C metal-binding domain-containing protein, partial [Chloroflexi bacterium]|nr:SEC-C metal-binding domain-containing protein [Chloroflexota bacterium]
MGHKIGRNDSCPCGSGEKYKKCCLAKIAVAASSWDMDKVGSMSTEEIFKKLNTMEIQTDQDQFLRDVHNFYSASSLANHWLRPIGLDIAEVDFVHYAAVILWERLAPHIINDEMIDHLMQEGYVEFEREKSKIGCHYWLTIWESLKPRFTSDMRSIRDAEIVFAGNQNLYNWTQNMEMELGNADLHEDRIKYCREFCDLFPESPESVILNRKMAEAAGYFSIGEKDKAETMFSDLQQEHPDSIWVYCRCGDLFVFSRNHDFVPDYEKAEKIY